MNRCTVADDQFVRFLKHAGAGMPTRGGWCKSGFSAATCYK